MGAVKLKKVIRPDKQRAAQRAEVPEEIFVYLYYERGIDDDKDLVGSVVLAKESLTYKEIHQVTRELRFDTHPWKYPKVIGVAFLECKEGRFHSSKSTRDNPKYLKKRRPVYCGLYPRIPKSYAGLGLGTLMYKALLKLAAWDSKKLRRKRLYFMPSASEAIKGCTSDVAWRCYHSLAKRGYLSNLTRSIWRRREHLRKDIYKVIRIPALPVELVERKAA